jgi:hypothetical protein
MNSVKYVGMDVHKSITVIVVLNAVGQVATIRGAAGLQSTRRL